MLACTFLYSRIVKEFCLLKKKTQPNFKVRLLYEILTILYDDLMIVANFFILYLYMHWPFKTFFSHQ